MADDYYSTLGVGRGASQDEFKGISQAARKYHPDMNPDDKAAQKKFKEVQQAYDVLSDEKKRKMYDQFGPQFEQMGGGAGPQWSGQVPPGYGGFDLRWWRSRGESAAGLAGFAAAVHWGRRRISIWRRRTSFRTGGPGPRRRGRTPRRSRAQIFGTR